MEIGIDSFAKKTQTNEGGTIADNALAMKELIDRICLLYTSPSPRDLSTSRMPSSA